MPHLRPVSFVLLLAVGLSGIACSEEDQRSPVPDDGGAGGTGGEGGEPPPDPAPVFDGLAEVEADEQDANSVMLRWAPATDDVTPPEELAYTLFVWQDHPDTGTEPRSYPLAAGANDFRYSGLPPEDVLWFAVEVRDADGNATGKAVLRPAVKPTVAPTLGAPAPASAAPGALVQLEGEHLLDEAMFDDALTLGGVPVPRASIVTWSTRLVEFSVPDGAVGGAITVRTPAGTAESPSPLEVP